MNPILTDIIKAIGKMREKTVKRNYSGQKGTVESNQMASLTKLPKKVTLRQLYTDRYLVTTVTTDRCISKFSWATLARIKFNHGRFLKHLCQFCKVATTAYQHVPLIRMQFMSCMRHQYAIEHHSQAVSPFCLVVIPKIFADYSWRR